MNYSLVGADRATHLKIVTVALVASILVGIAAHASHSSANSNEIAAAAPKLTDSHSFASIDRVTVCRFSAM
jgi:hypothetical protein